MRGPVLILLQRPAEHPRLAQALRSAVGYLLADLRLVLVFCGPAAAVLKAQRRGEALPAALRRPLDTLHACGQELHLAEEVDLPALARAAHAIIKW